MAVTLACADCGGPSRPMTEASLKKGSTVREPGEGLCPGCSSSRVLMVRAVDKLPKSLADIKAQRMAVSI
jgi:hypothetical protein